MCEFPAREVCEKNLVYSSRHSAGEALSPPFAKKTVQQFTLSKKPPPRSYQLISSQSEPSGDKHTTSQQAARVHLLSEFIQMAELIQCIQRI